MHTDMYPCMYVSMHLSMYVCVWVFICYLVSNNVHTYQPTHCYMYQCNMSIYIDIDIQPTCNYLYRISANFCLVSFILINTDIISQLDFNDQFILTLMFHRIGYIMINVNVLVDHLQCIFHTLH